MTPKEADGAAQQYFAEQYDVIARYPLVAPRPILLSLDNPDHRQCRFCGRDPTQTRFRNDAHAVSNLLGNKSLFSLNECNDCNTYLGQKFEDHLGKWSNLARVLARVPGKKNKVPKFKGGDGLVVEAVAHGLSIHVPYPHSPDELMTNGMPEEIELTGDTSSQSHGGPDRHADHHVVHPQRRDLRHAKTAAARQANDDTITSLVRCFGHDREDCGQLAPRQDLAFVEVPNRNMHVTLLRESCWKRD